MNKQQQKGHTDFLMSMLVFGVFAMSIIAVLIAGAGAYKRIIQLDTSAYDARICTGYITTKLRSADAEEISLIETQAPEGGALKITETIDDEEYASYIYCLDGSLYELYTLANLEPEYSCGEKLIDVNAVDMRLDDGLFTAKIETSRGEVRELKLYIGNTAGEEGNR